MLCNVGLITLAARLIFRSDNFFITKWWDTSTGALAAFWWKHHGFAIKMKKLSGDGVKWLLSFWQPHFDWYMPAIQRKQLSLSLSVKELLLFFCYVFQRIYRAHVFSREWINKHIPNRISCDNDETILPSGSSKIFLQDVVFHLYGAIFILNKCKQLFQNYIFQWFWICFIVFGQDNHWIN